MGLLEKLKETVGEGRVHPPDDSDVEAAAPNLWEMLTKDRWADNTPRVLPTITIARVSGGYRATLTDDSLWIRKSVTFHVLSDLVKALEAAVLSDSPWEQLAKSFRNKKGPPIPEEKTPRRKKG